MIGAQAASGSEWYKRLKAWWFRYREVHRHKLEFYQQLSGWMLPWIFIASIATLDGATCFDVEKRTCSYKKKAYSLTMTCLAALPMFRTALLGHELQRLGTKDSFIEFALLSKGMKIILAGGLRDPLSSHRRCRPFSLSPLPTNTAHLCPRRHPHPAPLTSPAP